MVFNKNCRGRCLKKVPYNYESDEHARQGILKKCPLLKEQEFLERYPDIVEVAEILDDSSEIHDRELGYFSLFKRFDIEEMSINQYLALLYKNHQGAIDVYTEVKRAYPTLGLKNENPQFLSLHLAMPVGLEADVLS